MSAFLKSVGERIRSIRKAQDLTQEALAEKAGLHYSYIGGVERGDRNISLETLEKIIDALGVLPVEIFLFDYADTEQEQVDKKQVLEALNSLLIGRNIQEVKMVHRLAKDILATIDEQKNI